jgi:hypothetical protein
MSFKPWLEDNHFDKDQTFWHLNPYGWKRWEGVLKHMYAEDQSHLLPAFKEYVNKLDAIRKINAREIFPELAHLL